MTDIDYRYAIESIQRHPPDVVRLAQVASLAVRVEPHLLRRLRIELHPDIDVGAEADLWFSDLVESAGARFVVLDPDVVTVLRQSLADDPDLLDRTRQVVDEEHATSPPSLRLEEHLNYLAVKGGEASVDDINDALRPALRTIAAGGETARDLAQWALRALPRLFPGALQCENGVALAMAASEALGQRRVLDQLPEIDASIVDIAWVLPADTLRDPVLRWMRLVADGVRVDDDGPEDQAIELPETTPLLLELSWLEGTEELSTLVQAEPGRAIKLGEGVREVTIRTLAGDEYRLERRSAEGSPAVRSDPTAGGTKWRRSAIVLGVDDFQGLGRAAQESAGAVIERFDDLRIMASEARDPGEASLRLRLDSASIESDLVWLHVIAPGLMRPRASGAFGRLQAIAVSSEADRIEWMPVRDLVAGLSRLVGRYILLTIEITDTFEGDPDVEAKSEASGEETGVEWGTTMVAITNGGRWEDHGPLTYLVLDSLPTELGSESGLTVGEFVERVRTGWNRWADNNDDERDNLTVTSWGDEDVPLVGFANEADDEEIEADETEQRRQLLERLAWILLQLTEGAASSDVETEDPERAAQRSRDGEVLATWRQDGCT